MSTDLNTNFNLLDHYAQRFAWRAENIYRSSSPHNASALYEELSARIALDPAILALVLDGDRATQVENLLFGAVHFLLLGGVKHPLANFYLSLTPAPRSPEGAYPYFRAFCLEHAEKIQQLVTTRRVQTNEVQRCTALMPAFNLVARQGENKPLALVEIGTSAGLNLLWDHYKYDYGEARYAGNLHSPVQLTCNVQGNYLPPIPNILPVVDSRIGIDINPIDVHDEQAIRWLMALIWPEHTDRAELLAQAIEVARQSPLSLVRGNAVDILPDVVANLPQETTLCMVKCNRNCWLIVRVMVGGLSGFKIEGSH